MDITSYVMGMNAGKKSAGGGGSGSGVLPAGCYLSVAEWSPPSDYRYKIAKLGEQIYAFAAEYSGYGDGTINKVYKLDSETKKWSNIISLSSGVLDFRSTLGVEYDGKLHLFYSKNHYVFDGATLTAYANLPISGTIYPTIYNGKIYCYFYGKQLLEWDDANDSWITHETFSNEMTCFSANGKLYITGYSSGNYIVYEYLDGILESKASCPGSGFLVYKNVIYNIDTNMDKSIIYKVNVSTGEVIEVGEIPAFQYYFFSINTNDISFTGALNQNVKIYVPYFIVNIVE